MNIITTVFALLMVMAILTYARLQTFLERAGFQIEYREYMTEEERKSFNEAQERHLNNLVSKGKDRANRSNENNPDEETKLSSSIRFDLIVKKTEREAHQKDHKMVRELLKELMEFLYGSHPFYREIKEKRPGIIDDWLNRLEQLTGEEVYKNKIVEAKEISSLNMGDQELNDFMYKILHGSRKKRYLKNEYQEKEGYIGLLEFVKVSPQQKLTSVYLASGEVLMALYRDVHVVDEILTYRKDLYKEFKASGKEDNEAVRARLSKKFKDAYAGQSILGPEDTLLLNFDVSGSNPLYYE